MSAAGVTFARQKGSRRPWRSLAWYLRGRAPFLTLLRQVTGGVVNDDCSDMAAKMAFYFILALFPFLIFLAAMVGFLPFTNLWDKVVSWMMLYLPTDLRRSVLVTILGLTKGRTGFLSFGVIGTAWTSSSGFVALMESLSVAYGVEDARGYWRKHALGLLMLVIVSFFFVTSFALMAAGHRIGNAIAVAIHSGPVFILCWEIARWMVTLLLLGLGVSLLDYILPNIRRKWRWMTPGSAIASVSLVVATLGFNFYVTHFGIYHRAYNALMGFIVLMLWIYIASFVLLIGAEINSVLEGLRQARGWP